MRVKVLITGASGFLGKKILNICIKREVQIHILGRNSVDENVEFTKSDICNKQEVVDAIQIIKPTHILHLASQGVTRDDSSLRDLLLVNTVATDNLLYAASTLLVKPYILLLGSAYEYESSDRPLTSDAKVNPKSPYAISKTASAYCMSRYADILPMLYLRLFNIYGPGEPKSRIIHYIVECALKGNLVNLTGCEQLRDFMYVEDLCEILLYLLLKTEKRIGPDIINIGTGIPVSLKAIVMETANRLNILGIQTNIKFGSLPYRKEDPFICYADASKMLSRIGNYKFTMINEGIEKTVESLVYERNRTS